MVDGIDAFIDIPGLVSSGFKISGIDKVPQELIPCIPKFIVRRKEIITLHANTSGFVDVKVRKI